MINQTLALAGRQCALRQWRLHRGEAPARDAVSALMLRQGEEVLAAARTAEVGATAGGRYEAKGVRVEPDLLTPCPGGGWRLAEVRASNEELPHHLEDLALQWHVLRAAGVDLREAWLWHLNRDYVHAGGAVDAQAIFIRRNRTAHVRALEPEIERLLETQREVLSATDAPEAAPGPHCARPQQCEFFESCNPAPPLDHISNLPGLAKNRRLELLSRGIHRIPDIPGWFPLNALQKRARAAVEAGEAWFSPDLPAALARLKHPLRFLDFETVCHAVPRLPGMRPWRYVPVQWSMHVEREPGAGLEHREFLFTGPGDPRPAFVESLLEAAGDAGPVVVFGKVFEDTRLKELAETVPAHSEALQALRRRLWDLHPVVKQHTAHPDYRGSFSIKSVLPALVPGMSYKDMEVGRGDQVQPVWERLAAGEGTDAERARWRQSLLDYCRLDTLAMVRILEALREPARVRRAP